MDLQTLKERRRIDKKHNKNSLDWILPIAKNVLSQMDSDELYSFILGQLSYKQKELEFKLLTIRDEEDGQV
tara:strand:- start:688 stop:900 length:213 start_codon:yes stop_codon:yes gene_type:complete